MQAVGALRAGRVAEAERQFLQVLQTAPAHIGALNMLAQIRFKAGDLNEAESLLRRAAAADPQHPDTHYNLGRILGAKGKRNEEIAAYRSAVAANPRHANALAHLAGALATSVQPTEALKTADKALELDARHPVALNNRGTALWQLGRRDEAIQSLRQATAVAPDYVAAHRNLGQCLLARGMAEDAVTAFRRALAIDPHDRGAEGDLAMAMRALPPPWHCSMLADTSRNALYRQAIEAAIRPGTLALDIGTGSGLLAMMAARGGAEKVVACEADPQLADVAKQIVALNGFSDRISVIARRSTDLKLGVDLPRRADLVLSEIFSADLIGEGVIPTMHHAIAELAAPGARVIPARAQVYGTLVNVPELRITNPVGRVDGFDLSPFERFRNKAEGMNVFLPSEEHALLSEPTELFTFDFTRPIEFEGERSVAFRATAASAVHAVVMWYRVELDAERAGSTRPGGELKHWATPLFFLDRDIAVKPGQEVAIGVRHDRITWRFSADA